MRTSRFLASSVLKATTVTDSVAPLLDFVMAVYSRKCMVNPLLRAEMSAPLLHFASIALAIVFCKY